MMDIRDLCQVGILLFVGMASAAQMDLSGKWDVALDGGEKAQVYLPGSLGEAKVGPAADKPVRGALCGALTPRYQYLGKAVYTRVIDLPVILKKDHELFLERVMWQSSFSFDGKPLGTRDSLCTPHVFRIPARLLTPGKHTLRVEIDNRQIYPIGENGHLYGDSMQSRWHGVVGRLLFREVNPLRKTKVYAPAGETVTVELADEVPAGISAEIAGVPGTAVTFDRPIRSFQLKVPRAKLWSDCSPNLYTLMLRAPGCAEHRIRFGFRTFSRKGNEFFLNGRPLFLRGNLNCCQFPLTGYPEMGKAYWKKIFAIQQREGANQIRFHSWCPPEAAFEAADEMGLLLAPEVIWIDGWMLSKDRSMRAVGKGDARLDAWVRSELDAQLAAYGNAASFFSLGVGNELGACNFGVMGKWLEEIKKADPRRLYFASTARSLTDADDMMITHSYPGIGGVRCWRKMGTDWDYESVYSRTAVPTIAHEIGQWPVYPDYARELPKYTGVLRPWTLELLQQKAAKEGMARFSSSFSRASLQLNRLMYKDEVESFLRTPSCRGISLLSMQDYSGQGEALVGWLDVFYNAKPGLENTPPFSSCFSTTTCLARFPKYTWTTDETFTAKLIIRHMGDQPLLSGSGIPWSLGSLRGKAVLGKALPAGAPIQVASLEIPLGGLTAPARLQLTFGKNSWPIWIYPAEISEKVPQNVVYTRRTVEARKALAEGKRVLLSASRLGTKKSSLPMHFTPVYWSGAWFPSQMNTLGLLIQEKSLAFAKFPTEEWQNWQWKNLVESAKSFRLEGNEKNFDPLAMPIPDFHTPTFSGVIFEARVGKGTLLVSGVDLENDIPEARQLKRSLLDYVASAAFAPKAEISVSRFDQMFADPRENLKPRPAEYKDAVAYIECATFLEKQNRDIPWRKADDRAELQAGDYQLAGNAMRTWSDQNGSYWVGRSLHLTLQDIPPAQGKFLVRFRDPNRNHRTAKGVFEQRTFDIPLHEDQKDGIYWLTLPLNREDSLDGKLEFKVEALTGPNIMIDRVIVLPDPQK